MAHPGQPRDAKGIEVDDEIDQAFSSANPNPDRVGCPSRDVLLALAERRLDIDDPAYDHLGACSPCYREFRALQPAHVLSTNDEGEESGSG